MNNKNYLFYPYSHKSYGFIRGLMSLDIEFDVIAPKGLGLTGKDMAYVVNGNDLGKKVKVCEEVDFSRYDAIIISENLNEFMETELDKIIEKSKENNLEIFNYCDKEKYLKLFENISLKNIKNNKEKVIKKSIDKSDKFNLPFYTPEKLIIFVGGIIETIDNFYISLQVKIGLEKMGYKVEMITKDNDGRFFDCLKYPVEFMSNKVSPEVQIHKLNKFIQGIEEQINPHIIIMDLPKGLIKYDKYYDNSFGIYTFMIGQSVRPDYFILNTLNNYISEEYFNKLNDYFEVILGKKVDVFNLINSFFQHGNTVKTELEMPMYLKHKDLENIISLNKGINLRIDCLYEQKRIDSMIKKLIDNFT